MGGEAWWDDMTAEELQRIREAPALTQEDFQNLLNYLDELLEERSVRARRMGDLLLAVMDLRDRAEAVYDRFVGVMSTTRDTDAPPL